MPTAIGLLASRLTETVFVPTSWSISFGFREQMLMES
jgi:hypothetical protein